MKSLLRTMLLLTCFSLAAFAQTFRVLHTFNRTDGSQPYGRLVQGLDGNLYGTTSGGGTHNGHGTIFKIDASGGFTNLFNFNGEGDGGQLYDGLTLVPDGSFYGVTSVGGLPARGGTIFKLTRSKFTTLYAFDRLTASLPYGGLLLGADGNLYGTSSDEGGTLTRLPGAFIASPRTATSVSCTTLFTGLTMAGILTRN